MPRFVGWLLSLAKVDRRFAGIEERLHLRGE